MPKAAVDEHGEFPIFKNKIRFPMEAQIPPPAANFF